MSYAGMYGPEDECPHGNYQRNCTACIIENQEKTSTRDEFGVLHSDNGAGWCVGHIEGGKCVVLVRHCPVLNTAEQLSQNLRDDKAIEVQELRDEIQIRRSALAANEKRLSKAEEELKAINNGPV